jgi:hypothetical protein
MLHDDEPIAGVAEDDGNVGVAGALVGEIAKEIELITGHDDNGQRVR